MTKKKVKLIVAVMMLLTVALYFISGTYARYTDTFNGTGTANVVKWAVKVNNEETTSFTLTFQQEENNFVVDGLIAPDVTLKSNAVAIDLTGTQVAVDVEATIDPDELQSALEDLGTSKDDVKTAVKIYKGTDQESGTIDGKTIALPDQSNGFSEQNGKFNIVVTVTWEDQGGTHDLSDTEAGKKASTDGITLNIPVKVTLKQHLATDGD